MNSTSTTTTSAAERRPGLIHTEGLTRAHYAAMGLAAVTGAIHLYLYWAQEFLPFLVAGVGFFGAVGLLFLTATRWPVYLAGIPYTLAQMVAWVLADTPEFTLGVADKVVQAALIVLLVVLYRRDRAARRAARSEADPAPAN